jgi:RNA polymerase sigma-B factor
MPEPFPQPGLADLSDRELAGRLREPRWREEARETLVYRYQPMVRALAYQYQLPAQHYEDLIQVGYVGLMKAINSFDPGVRPELKPFAHACVSGEIKRYFRDKRWVIRVSRADQELLLAAKKAQADLNAELGGTPTTEQVAAHLSVPVEQLEHAYQAHQAFAPESLDEPLSVGDERKPGDLIGSDDPAFTHTEEMDAVRQHFTELPTAQRKVLLLRFYGNMTQAQVATRLNCSQMHVSRLQSRALAFLRGRLQVT